MTHEELLDKFPLSSFYTNDQLNGMLRAIRAVVELHKPITDDDIYYECLGCGNNNPYENCPTIQAIEKELR